MRRRPPREVRILDNRIRTARRAVTAYPDSEQWVFDLASQRTSEEALNDQTYPRNRQ